MTTIGVLFAVGVVLLAFEVFLPGGILGIFAGLTLLGGCVLAFVDFGVGGGVIALLVALALVGAVLYFEFAILPRTAFGRRLFLHSAIGGKSTPARGRSYIDCSATTATALAPTGYITLDGRRYEAFSRAGFLEAGVAVKVVGEDNFRLIVVPEPLSTFS